MMIQAKFKNEFKGCDCEYEDHCSCGPEADYDALCKLVDAFAVAMKAKLRDKVGEGYSGWDQPRFASRVQDLMINHAVRARETLDGPVDVANFAAFMWNFEKV